MSFPGASSALLIHISGHDKPGVTHALTSILARHEVRILDIGQAVIHDGLALGILIELSQAMRSSSLLTDLLLAAHQLDVQVKFSAASADEYMNCRDTCQSCALGAPCRLQSSAQMKLLSSACTLCRPPPLTKRTMSP